ncbi:MAG: hypothetical protein Q7S20_00450 [Gemmatimonadaceae bacterium]|nr:hypothetical protein [Gemmatimonadaceae bacterium]
MIKESHNWSYNAAPTATSERLTRARLQWCSTALGKLGCAIPNGGRLSLALRLLDDLANGVVAISEVSIRDQIAEVQRMAWEFMLILIAAVDGRQAPSPFTVDKLEQMLRGALVPGGGDDPARNIQFELYVPALLALGGFAIHPGPPDAKVTIFDEQIGVEAKRVSSLNPETLRSHLRNASRQAVGSRSVGILEIVEYRGIIAVNVDTYFNELRPQENPIDLIKQFQNCLDPLDNASKVLRDKTGIIGLLACGYVAGWHSSSDGYRFDVLYPTRWVSLHGDDKVDRRLAEQLTMVLGRMERRCREIQAQVPKALTF